MAEKTIDTRLKVRGDTASNWSSANPTLLKNEVGYDETNKKFKIGDGTTPWNSLAYCNFAPSNSGIYYVEGTGTTAGTWTGSNSEITSYYDGLTILYKVNIAGASTTKLNINSLGAKTVYRYGTTKLTTQYPVNSVILISYMADLNSGCWMVIGDYDANTYQRLYPTTDNVEYPITTRYNTTIGSSYYAEYGRYSTGVTLNPSTNTITATKFNGTSTRAIADENGNNIASTYALKSEISGGSVNLEPIDLGGWLNINGGSFSLDGAKVIDEHYTQFLQNKTAPIKIGDSILQMDSLTDKDSDNYYAQYVYSTNTHRYYVAICWYADDLYIDETYSEEIGGSSSVGLNIYPLSGFLNFDNPVLSITASQLVEVRNANAISCSALVSGLGHCNVILYICSNATNYICFTDAMFILEGQKFYVRRVYIDVATLTLNFTPGA